MKSQILKAPQKEVLQFPLLARILNGESKGTVVLFSEERAGTVVNSLENSNGHCALGSYSAHWVSVFDKFFWEILAPSEQILLSN